MRVVCSQWLSIAVTPAGSGSSADWPFAQVPTTLTSAYTIVIYDVYDVYWPRIEPSQSVVLVELRDTYRSVRVCLTTIHQNIPSEFCRPVLVGNMRREHTLKIYMCVNILLVCWWPFYCGVLSSRVEWMGANGANGAVLCPKGPTSTVRKVACSGSWSLMMFKLGYVFI
jgi:hypothetical protein